MLEVRLLGEVAVLVDGRPVDAGSPRQRCVLAALAVDGDRVVSVDRLMARVWGDATPPRARATLVNYLSRLRGTVGVAGTAGVVRGAGGYALRTGDGVVDLHRFRDLRARARTCADGDGRVADLLAEALGLWRGDALTGVDGDWAAAERARLHRERADAKSDLTDALLRLGHGEDLVAELADRVAEWPWDERVASRFMLALHRAGRTADALAHYRRLRDRLVDELGSDPGAALRELHRRILADDPALRPGSPVDAPRPRATAAPVTPSQPPAVPVTPRQLPAVPVTPRQLPAAPASFVGRRAELDRLDAARRVPAGAVSVTSIAGAGGIGKTWLALHWAHRRLDEFPDGQLFVDLRGFGPDSRPMEPAAAVRGFLDALGVEPDRLPADPHAQAALFRSLVADRRVLVLLDNAATSDQVAPLLPGGGSCTVVVTSRHRLPGLVARHGVRPLLLDVLTDAEAHAALAAALGAARVADERRAVAELVRACGGFPLALGVIAAHARTRPEVPLDEVATELRESGLDTLADDDPTASLPAVLSWSLRHLTPRQREVFALLGIAPGRDTGVPAAACLTDLPPAAARRELQALQDASLVDRDARGRYAMHDLVRAYATTLAQDLAEPVRQAALRRVVDFYLHSAHHAACVLDPHRTPVPVGKPAAGVHPDRPADEGAATAWLDVERPNVLAAQHTAAAAGRTDVVWQLAGVLSTFHDRRGHLRDDLVVWRTAVEATADLPDPATRALAHRRLGRACSRSGRHEEAVDHLRQALDLARRARDPAEQANVHHTLAMAWERQGDDRRALEHAERALALHRAAGHPVREALALNSVGWYAARCGDHDTAREHCRAALALHRDHDNPTGEAATLDSLGWIEHHTGHHREAVEHYRHALDRYRGLGDTYEIAGTLDRLGHPLAALGRHDEVRRAWREALELYRDQGRDADAERVRRQLDALDDDPAHRHPHGP
ncbi:AfsR/SARP family transcriptional regulator [Actinosynnema sp. NPDC004786]